MADPAELLLATGGGALVMKALDFAFRRYVSRADAREQDAEKAESDRTRDAEHKRDAREAEMNRKLDELLKEVATLSTETRRDRETATTTAAAIQAAVAEVKSRIDGVSANHGPRLGAVEQELAGLRARIDVIVTPRGKR